MKYLKMFGLTLAASAIVLSCQKEEPGVQLIDNFNPFSETVTPDSYYGYAQISVPAGTHTIYVQYKSKSGEKIIPVEVEPIVARPEGGKDVEPFGMVKLLLTSKKAASASVYYLAGDNLGTRAGDNQQTVYSLQDFPLDQVTSGEFGKTRYVQVQWDFGYQNDESTNWRNEPTYPADVVLYDAEHNHTLRYKFAYSGTGYSTAYFLDDAYVIEDYEVKGLKYNYCNSCGIGCPYCMPWGCACGCGGVNPNFTPNGHLNDAPAVGDGTGNVVVDEHGTIIADYAPNDITTVNLPEPANYVTTNEDQTFYHSSGVVMFEDSWPSSEHGKNAYDYDFDDVVIDYDFEAKVMPERLLGVHQEEVKVVIHVRVVGSNQPYRVGVRMEGFDQQYVESVQDYFTLDSYGNPHGELPAVAKITFANPENTKYYLDDPMNPVVEVAKLQTFNEKRCGEGANAEYTYTNGNFTNHTVFNLTYGFKEQDKSQYDPDLENLSFRNQNKNITLQEILKQKYYNCIPGYVNVSGGLFTYTVVFTMKNRAEMSAVESEKAKQNMIQAVMNTLSQNFYIIADKNFTPVGLKGYDPVMVHKESEAAYNNKVSTGVASGSIDASNPYAGLNGEVWGFKCPTLTKHVWNKMFFDMAYPLYKEWISSAGASHSDWYYNEVDGKYLSCWW